MTEMQKTKFKVGDIVVIKHGLGQVALCGCHPGDVGKITNIVGNRNHLSEFITVENWPVRGTGPWFYDHEIEYDVFLNAVQDEKNRG